MMKLPGHPLDGTWWGIAIILINVVGAVVWLYLAVTQDSAYWAVLAVLWILLAGVWGARYVRGRRAQQSPQGDQ